MTLKNGFRKCSGNYQTIGKNVMKHGLVLFPPKKILSWKKLSFDCPIVSLNCRMTSKRRIASGVFVRLPKRIYLFAFIFYFCFVLLLLFFLHHHLRVCLRRVHSYRSNPTVNTSKVKFLEVKSKYKEMTDFLLALISLSLRMIIRTIARWRHFTTTTRILEFVVFLCKLRLLFFNSERDWQI